VLGLRFALMTSVTPLGVAAAGIASEALDTAVLVVAAGSAIAAIYLVVSLVQPVKRVLRLEGNEP
jgi:ABC-type Zn2+ transport system substrate-binding protein/surface adhesin